MKCSLGISNFLQEISSLSHSTVLHWSLKAAFLSLLASLWNSAFRGVYLSFSPLPFPSLLFTAICKASSDNHFAFVHFFSLGMVLIPASCTMSDSLSTELNRSIESLNPLAAALCVCGGGWGWSVSRGPWVRAQLLFTWVFQHSSNCISCVCVHLHHIISVYSPGCSKLL